MPLKKIMLIGHSGENRLPVEKSKAWTEFANTLYAQGYQIVEDFSREVVAIISNCSKQTGISKREFLSIVPKNRTIIIWEPFVVDANLYKQEVLQNYGNIYAASPMWARKTGGSPFNWPQENFGAERDVFTGWEKRIEKSVIIQANKYSARRGELYSLRRKVIGRLSYQLLDIYGPNWNKGRFHDLKLWYRSARKSKISELSLWTLHGIGKKYSNYAGEAEDKQEILQKYQVNIVIENSADYVSEKLFDSLRAGCLTVYVGPDLEKFSLRSKSIICAQPTFRDVHQKIKEIALLSERDRCELAMRQRREIMESMSEWENSKVLRELAHSIVKNME